MGEGRIPWLTEEQQVVIGQMCAGSFKAGFLAGVVSGTAFGAVVTFIVALMFNVGR